MGNTNKRSTSRTSHPGAQWDEENVLRLIAEKKLAPKHIEKEIMNKSCSECPICFLDFTLLNTVHCCKQSICTDCVVQLKCIEGKAACPFCGNVEMQVSLIPSDPRTNNSNSENSTNKKEECPGDSDPPSSRSSESSRVSLSYTTPEQERKLRSFSQDLSTSVATKNDREELERQIREQRMHFDERDLAEAAIFNRGSYFNSSGPGRVSSRGRAATTQRASRHRFNADGSIPAGHNMGPPGPNARFVTRALLQGGAISTENEQDGEGSSLSPSRMLANSIEGLLGSRAPLSGISSLEQLEDIMLMEAIRLSMQDAAPSEPASHSSRGATLSSTTANQNMTFNSQSDSNDLRLHIDSSGSDEDYLRESDLLSEEEEQMRLALELSLTSLRNETGSSESTASQQDQDQPSIALLAAPKESSERDVVCAPPDMVAFAEDGEAPSDCPLSADDVDVDVVGTQTNSSPGDEAPITKMPANDSEEVTSTTGLPC